MPLIKAELPNLLHRGKVRDTFELGNDLLLMVSTDRLSAFDVVLPNGIPDKGYVLSRLSKFWFGQTAGIIDNHFLALADDSEQIAQIDSIPDLTSVPHEIARQAMIVRRAERIDVECVVRAYITGSAWAEYRKSGTIFGQLAPRNLREGDRFPELLFTPTTKADEGHDMPMTMGEVSDLVGSDMASQLQEASFKIFQFAHDIALEKGIIIADTKMEFGIVDGKLILIDELLTPDSSRFWDADGYEPGKSLPNFDKQYVRDWLIDTGWDREPPAPVLPDEIVMHTSERYRAALKQLTGSN